MMIGRYLTDRLLRRTSMCLFTAKHTGTHFVMNHLMNMGFRQAFIEPMGRGFEAMPGGRYFYHLHVEERHHFCRVITRHDVMVTTLRDPRKVFYSLGHRRPYLPEQAEAHVLFAFEQWHKFVAKYNPIIVRVDHGDVNLQMGLLAARLGVRNFRYIEVDRNHRQEREFDHPVPPSLTKLALTLGYSE